MTDATAPVTRSDEPRVVFISAASGLAGDWRWVEETADLYDVVHWHDDVHGLTVAQARDLVRALKAAEKPLVISVPPDVLDTALPRIGEEERIDAFSVLIPAAAVLLARDGGSAEAVWRAWGGAAWWLPRARRTPCPPTSTGPSSEMRGSLPASTTAPSTSAAPQPRLPQPRLPQPRQPHPRWAQPDGALRVTDLRPNPVLPVGGDPGTNPATACAPGASTRAPDEPAECVTAPHDRARGGIGRSSPSTGR